MNTNQFGGKHRAKASVLMRVRASLRDLGWFWRVRPNLERLGYSRSSLRDWTWAATVAMMCLALVPWPLARAADAADTNVPVLTVEALVVETLAKNPELNFYKAEMAAAKGERQMAGAWANPEVAGTAGSKRSVAPGASGEGLAW